MTENLGQIERRAIVSEVKQLDQDARATLRRHGVRFGAFHVFLPLLLKPAPTALICLLWAIKNNKLDAPGLSEIPQISAMGRTSMEIDPGFAPEIYPLCGFRIMGNKAVRIDILERLADLIRPALAWRENSNESNAQAPNSQSPPNKPEGAYDGSRFYVTPAMLSILGATHEDMEQVLKELGYRSQKFLESEIFPAQEGEKSNDNAKEDDIGEVKNPASIIEDDAITDDQIVKNDDTSFETDKGAVAADERSDEPKDEIKPADKALQNLAKGSKIGNGEDIVGALARPGSKQNGGKGRTTGTKNHIIVAAPF